MLPFHAEHVAESVFVAVRHLKGYPQEEEEEEEEGKE